MSNNAITMSNEFAVVRTSKAGKETYRGALGVITSGNAAERGQLAMRAIETMIANNNFRGVMREVSRVFPVTGLKKSAGVAVRDGDVYLVSKEENRITLELLDVSNPNKATAMLYAAAVIEVHGAKELKGEKALYLAALRGMVAAEVARIEAAKAETVETE